MNYSYDAQSYTDFNDAEDQASFDLIPDKTIAKVRLHITPGGFTDAKRNWNDGYATHNPESNAVYLKCDFTILEGPYQKRKIFSNIGLHSEKGVTWANMGRSFLKGILNSARGINPKDQSEQACRARQCPHGLGDIDGIDFIALIEQEKQGSGENQKTRNVIQKAITPGHKDYPGAPMSFSPSSSTYQQTSLPSWAPQHKS
ncbi:hypothetical protein Cva_00669 [Caedimonas varicaedens]|uniref:Uncharacterized protein n=1 Tax=Caedimonas varicaedens TaxID=1629334 RepID=A0A0K8MBZ4_9PROT|nr:hypothetical protein Cva_00669 [Caedimonas varicaedens]